jgi:hypothetical protein
MTPEIAALAMPAVHSYTVVRFFVLPGAEAPPARSAPALCIQMH